MGEQYYSDDEGSAIHSVKQEKPVLRGEETYQVQFPINAGKDDKTFFVVLCGGLNGPDWNEPKKNMLVSRLHEFQMEVEFTGPHGFSAKVTVDRKERAYLSQKQALRKKKALENTIGNVLEELKIVRRKNENNLLY
jgi:hypothetical protein